MKYLIPFFIFAISSNAYAFSIGETRNGLVFETPDNKIYYLDRVGERLKTYGVDGTCYWYDGTSFSDCTPEERNVSSPSITPQNTVTVKPEYRDIPSRSETQTMPTPLPPHKEPSKPYTLSTTEDTIRLTTNKNLRIVINEKEVQYLCYTNTSALRCASNLIFTSFKSTLSQLKSPFVTLQQFFLSHLPFLH